MVWWAPWRREDRSAADRGDAARAREEQERKLAEVERQGEEVQELARRLKQSGGRNHFAEVVDRALRRPT